MPAEVPSWLNDLVSAYGAETKTLLAGPGNREDTIRPSLRDLVTKIGDKFGLTVVMHSEVRLTERQVRPDYAVEVNGSVVGYIEVKAPGEPLNPDGFTGHNKRQWLRVRDVPNLIYTNGTEWRLYRNAERVGDPVQFTGGSQDTAGAHLSAPPQFEPLMRQFLGWEPVPITTVPRLVAAVAPLTRLLRADVLERLNEEHRAADRGARPGELQFTSLAGDWRRLLFPDATDDRFADGYAQTVTFALLLASSDGVDIDSMTLHSVGDEMRSQHSLMGRALQLLTDEMAAGFRLSLALMTRTIGSIRWERIRASPRDTYLYLYENFLAEYDPALRQESGSYYTPLQVVEQMVRITEDVLRQRWNRTGGFADDEVTVVDPAMGTGTFMHSIIERASEHVAASDGPGAVPGRVTDLARRLIGFEIQTGPYAVAELRTSDMLRRLGANAPKGGMRTYVTNTLDDPFVETDQLDDFRYRALSESRRRANEVKARTPVTVVIGNPPYRERAEGEGGWVEHGDAAHGDRRRAVLEDFRAEGNGQAEYVLKNLYVYFWRWATWKVFDAVPDDRHGVVCFISTNGYQRGPGFKGMREYLRRTCTAGWIIDLSPEGHQPDVATRVFPGVQQTISIGIFVRDAVNNVDRPADVSYVALAGRRAEKFAALADLTLDSGSWRPARTDWQAPFTPAADTDWDAYPALNDLMPWSAPGVKPNRTWVYAPEPAILRGRWDALVNESDLEAKRRLFRESDSARLDLKRQPLPGISSQPDATFADQPGVFPSPVRIGFRSFDRQWLIPDARLIHRPSPPLWQARQEGQIFVIEQHSESFADGPGLVFSALIPDMHHFNNRGGRALALLHPNGDSNVAPGLLEALASIFEAEVSGSDLVAYLAATVACPAYTRMFRDEMTTPGVRVPITSDPEIWREAVALGRRVVWAQTYGEAFHDPGAGRPPHNIRLAGSESGPQPLNLTPISEMPSTLTYDEESMTVALGDGRWGPVDPRVFAYEVGGRRVLKSWFDYRKKEPGGRRSSPLDSLHVTTWPSAWTTEFTDLLTVLTRLVLLEDEQRVVLEKIVASRLLNKADLAAHGVNWPVNAVDRRPRTGPSESGRIGEQLSF